MEKRKSNQIRVKEVNAIFKHKAYSKKYQTNVTYYFKFKSYNVPYGLAYGIEKNHEIFETWIVPPFVMALLLPIISIVILLSFIRILEAPFPLVILLIVTILDYFITGSMIYIPWFRSHIIDRYSKRSNGKLCF